MIAEWFKALYERHGINFSVFYDKVQDTVAVGFDLFLRAGAR